MDTKWKKSKAAAGVLTWLVFFGLLVCCLVIWVSVLAAGYGNNLDAVLKLDYQMTEEFRDDIVKYLEIFMRSDNEESLRDSEEILDEDIEYVHEYYNEDTGYSYFFNNYDTVEILDFHENVKSDRNILYTVTVDGKVLCTNEDTLSMYTDQFTMPAGYNFMLYFDGEKVKIVKDGVEENVYGDGILRENKWYVPGYSNYPVEEAFKNVRICVVAVENPFMVIEDGGRYINNVYRIQEELVLVKTSMIITSYMAAAALLCLVLTVILRKERRDFCKGIAAFTGKVFLEAKLLLSIAAEVLSIILLLKVLDYFYWDLEFLSKAYFLIVIPVMIMYLSIWIIINDFRNNEKTWNKSIIALLIRTYNTAGMKLPLGKRILRQNLCIIVVQWITLISFFILIILMAEDYLYGEEALLPATVLVLLHIGLGCFQFSQGAKNRRMTQGADLLVEQIKDIHDGKLSGELVLSEDTGFSEAGKYLNDIGKGMEAALNEQMKSERMKVELITNVSHDIKTPLTSIISYVELLKQEELPEHAAEYIEIIDQKSKRLKTMIQDVFEVSKAVSGELHLKSESLDLGKLLRQTLADMQEQLSGGEFILKTEIPEEPVLILADGERLYRVFQNLIQNAVNYSLAGSRIYIQLICKESWAYASIRNTSREELPQDIDFTERFVRGDKSRTDSGSGLGLSIAKGFVEACGGRLEVKVIADLFVVTAAFPVGK